MSHKNHGKVYWDTHFSCKSRIEKEGKNSKCCECDPHKNCELVMKNSLEERLKKFAEFVLRSYSWDDCAEPDGLEIQNKAEELGLIELRPISEEVSIDGEKEYYFPVWL